MEFIYLPESVYPGHQSSVWKKKIGQNLSAQDKEEWNPLMKLGVSASLQRVTRASLSR